jgi:hypothetical protein
VRITGIRLLAKEGGRSGSWHASAQAEEPVEEEWDGD